MELSKTAQIISIESAKEFKGTFVDIFNNQNYKSVRTISKNIGVVDTKKVLYMLMATIVVDPKTGKSYLDIEPENTQQLIDNIMENYPDVSLEDVTYFTKRLVRGEFIGKKIGDTTIKVFKYDVPTLCLMFQRHYAERIEAIEDIRQRESNEHKVVSEMHPDILKMFSENEAFKGVYQNIEQYCERNEMQLDVFETGYANLYDEYLEHDKEEQDEKKKKLPKAVFTGEYKEVNKLTIPVFEDQITKEEFINHMIAQFLVVQNQILTQTKINESYNMLQMVQYAKEYDVDGLVSMCKRLGLWMIPTKYYFAARKIFLDGGEIKYRYDINEGIVVEFTKFLNKFLLDESQGVQKPLFVTAMIFNFVLNINRFNKYNSNAGE